MKEILRLQSVINKLLESKTNIKVLEAGCGSSSYIQFEKNAYVVGIDVSEKQLRLNSKINEKILGDIQSYDFQPSIFDVIICWNVLEHLPKPEMALEKFAKATKENGIIVLALPNVLSFKGLVTKYTPHWFHILYYKHVWGIKNAGKDHTAPFKAYLKFSMRIQGIKKFANSHNLKVIYFDNYDVADYLHRKSKIYIIYRLFNAFLKIASFGILRNSEFFIVLQK